MPSAKDQDTVAALSRLLADALVALGRAGYPETANRLAGQAWSALRHSHPREAERVNSLMHGIAKLSPTEKENRMSVSDLELDVRAEVPARRHELIFETYEELGAGEAFTLVNDHDPKPLYYQFAAEHEGEFSWEYLEQGPEVWRVRIGRTP
ncbi:MAG TPA: DUF2249 domain-containing protein [Thermoleophilaceae bacterium]